MTRRLRGYHELTDPDRSGIGEQVAAQRQRVAARLAGVRRTVAVMSGKGGVGKSFVAAHLAIALRSRGLDVGLLDADLNGPTIPRLLTLPRQTVATTADGVRPATTAEGVRVFSMAFLMPDGDPLRWSGPAGDAFVWRGTLEAGALRELLADVAWGALDVLVVDLPPGTPRLDDLRELVPALSGVIAVTIPSAESLDAVRRALRAARDAGAPVLGIVENMAGHACRACGHEEPVFPGDAGAALAREFGVEILARLPFAPAPALVDELGAVVAGRLEAP